MPQSLKQKIAMAIREPDTFVIRCHYQDKWGDQTERVISPIRFLGQNAVLALCLGREEPRRFELARMSGAKLTKSSDVLMPEPVKRGNS